MTHSLLSQRVKGSKFALFCQGPKFVILFNNCFNFSDGIYYNQLSSLKYFPLFFSFSSLNIWNKNLLFFFIIFLNRANSSPSFLINFQLNNFKTYNVTRNIDSRNQNQGVQSDSCRLSISRKKFHPQSFVGFKVLGKLYTNDRHWFQDLHSRHWKPSIFIANLGHGRSIKIPSFDIQLLQRRPWLCMCFRPFGPSNPIKMRLLHRQGPWGKHPQIMYLLDWK